jgi:mono/diheme cytochrome c family protein
MPHGSVVRAGFLPAALALTLVSLIACATPPAPDAGHAAEDIEPPPTPGVAKVSRVEKAFAAADESQNAPPNVENGRAIGVRYCGSCHAVDRKGRSSRQNAPAFSTLSQNYPVEALSESLAEGLDAGHPDMPQYTFQPSDIRDFVAYLESIQDTP